MKKRIILAIGLYVVGAYLWYRYRLRNSFWGRAASHQWDQIEAQMKYGRQAPLDPVLVLAEVAEWLEDKEDNDES